MLIIAVNDKEFELPFYEDEQLEELCNMCGVEDIDEINCNYEIVASDSYYFDVKTIKEMLDNNYLTVAELNEFCEELDGEDDKQELLLAIVDACGWSYIDILESIAEIDKGRYTLYNLSEEEFCERMYRDGIILCDLPEKYAEYIDWGKVWGKYYKYDDDTFATNYGILCKYC